MSLPEHVLKNPKFRNEMITIPIAEMAFLGEHTPFSDNGYVQLFYTDQAC